MQKMDEMKQELEKYKNIIDAEDTSETEIKRYAIKNEQKMLKILSKNFSTENKFSEDVLVKKQHVQIFDKAHIVMIIAKTEEAKRLVSRFYSSKTIIPKAAEQKSYIAKESQMIRTTVSCEYLLDMVELLKLTSEYITFFMRGNYPVRMETDEMVVILAPRIDESDEKALAEWNETAKKLQSEINEVKQ